ncbi:hypothetical protein ACU8V7_13410 [Zobellia nedashkovskayae]
MDKAIKAIDKESLHYNFQQYDGADHISIATYGLGKVFDNIFGMFKPISPKEYKNQILTSEEPVFQYLENKYQNIEDLFRVKKTVDSERYYGHLCRMPKKGGHRILKASCRTL